MSSSHRFTGREVATTVNRGEDGSASVKYHDTEVYRLDSQGVLTLNTGGWKTITTKRRMNQAIRTFGPQHVGGVYQRAGAWYVDVDGVGEVEFLGEVFKASPDGRVNRGPWSKGGD